MKVLTKYVPYTRTTGCERRGREMRRPTVYSLRRLVPLALTLCVLLGAALLCISFHLCLCLFVHKNFPSLNTPKTADSFLPAVPAFI